MTGSSVQPIRALIPAVLRQVEQHQGTLAAIQREWRTLVGRRLAAGTRPASLRQKRLVVTVESPGEAFLLNYCRPPLLKRLRATTQGKVEEIIIRPGSPQRRSRLKAVGSRQKQRLGHPPRA